jgi:hypothetical protein
MPRANQGSQRAAHQLTRGAEHAQQTEGPDPAADLSPEAFVHVGDGVDRREDRRVDERVLVAFERHIDGRAGLAGVQRQGHARGGELGVHRLVPAEGALHGDATPARTSDRSRRDRWHPGARRCARSRI